MPGKLINGIAARAIRPGPSSSVCNGPKRAMRLAAKQMSSPFQQDKKPGGYHRAHQGNTDSNPNKCAACHMFALLCRCGRRLRRKEIRSIFMHAEFSTNADFKRERRE